MKKQVLSIILAPVLLLSVLCFPVFAQEISESQAVEYFGVIEDWAETDLALAGVDLTEIDLSTFSSKGAEDVVLAPETVEVSDELAAKSILDPASVTITGKYVPCGNGKFNLTIKVKRENPLTAPEGTATNAKNAIYVKSIKIKNVENDPTAGEYELENCDVCKSDGRVTLDVNGEATIKGTITIPHVYDNTAGDLDVDLDFLYASSKTAPDNPVISLVTQPIARDATSFCPGANWTVANGGFGSGKYEQCGGKASFKVDVEIPAANGPKFVVPSEIHVGSTVYTDYVCRYTLFGSSGYPFGGDYCKPGYQVPVKPGQRIRFEAVIADLTNPLTETSGGADLDVKWRFGATSAMVTGKMNSVAGSGEACKAKIVPLRPIAPTAPAKDDPLKPGGWYNTYENAVVGLYQKCGRFAVMQVRVKNVGGELGTLTLPGSVAVNGGTPISYFWLSSIPPVDGKVEIAPDETVTLFGHLWLTNITSQTNSNSSVNVSVMLPEVGLYMNGKLYSDRVNWRCY